MTSTAPIHPPHPAHAPSHTPRLHQLDALRGLASATVVAHHWAWIIPTFHVPFLLLPFITGREAVILFFVLSGYVLSLPFAPTRNRSYAGYVVRRLGRIYLPFVAAVALSAIGCALFYRHGQSGLASWYYLTWQQPVTPSLILRELAMSPTKALNPAFWSLTYELAISLIFPLFWPFLLRRRRVWSWVLVLTVKAADLTLWRTGHRGTYIGAALEIATYFLLGAAIARERNRLLHLVRTARTPSFALALILSIAAYINYWFFHLDPRRADLITAIGAAVLILLVQHPTLTALLDTAVPRFLGRISYSLYLVHGAVLFALLDTLYQRIPNWTLGILFAFTAVLAASIFCLLIEEPAHRLGKSIARRITTPSTAESAALA